MIYRYCKVYENIPFKNLDIFVYPKDNEIRVVEKTIYDTYIGEKPDYILVYWLKGELGYYYFKSDLYYLSELVSCGVIGNNINEMINKHFEIIFGE